MFFQGFFRNSLNYTKKKKKSFVSGNAGDEKNLHPGSRKFIFLSIFRRYSLLFFNFFCFFYSCFLFVCLFFLKIKMYIPIHIRQYGRVSDKKIFTRPISGNNTTFIVASRSSLFLEKVNFLKLTIKTGLNHVKLFHSRESRHHHNYFIDLVLMYL